MYWERISIPRYERENMNMKKTDFNGKKR